MQNTVQCPKCNHEFNVADIFARQAEEESREKYAVEVEKLTQERNALAAKEAAVKEQAAAIDKKVAEKAREEIARREKVIAKQAEEKVKSDFEVQVKSLTEAAAESKKQLQELKSAQIENERLKRQIESQKQDTALEMEKKLAENDEQNRKRIDVLLKTEKENSVKREAEIIKREVERNEERFAELQKQLSDARKAAEDAVRKAEQRSQQLQGEIQELAIEEFLRATFPFDQVNEVKKGQYGADVVQVVRNSIGNESGIILYESKNTESFNKEWIDKLKADAVEVQADVLIIVTKTMPKGLEHTELMEGVWVCPVKEFQGTARVLREGLLRLTEAYSTQTNKEGKMQMLYDYLTNGKFVDQIKQVIADFNELRNGYEKEKISMQKIWKKRDTQIEAMLKNTTNFVTQIQVIAGSSLPRLDAPEDELLMLGESE